VLCPLKDDLLQVVTQHDIPCCAVLCCAVPLNGCLSWRPALLDRSMMGGKGLPGGERGWWWGSNSHRDCTTWHRGSGTA